MSNERLITLRKKAAALPAAPGVYIMKDREGRVLYVGKSRKLCNRVGSYFVGSHNRKTERMVAAVHDFDAVLCGTEMEALTLENTLIKKHSPPFNIKLKDAKSYPYLKITEGVYPRVVVTRDRREGGEYFGPYPGMSEAYAALDAVSRAFLLPTCRRRFPEDIGRERPCLYADMGRCMALCRTPIPPEEYAERIRGVRRVLSGRIADTLATTTEAMLKAADEERFEEAARLRDTAAALTRLREHQRVVGDPDVECDAVAVHSDIGGGMLSLLSIREGALIAKRDFPLGEGELHTPDAIFTLLGGLYTEGSLPREILLDFPADAERITEFSDTLTAIGGRRVYVLVPERGQKKKLCAMALENARLSYERREAERTVSDEIAVRLAALAALEVVPERIEAFDISELGTENVTASMVVYEHGKKKPADYRLFRMKTVEGTDDYASMREAITRRLAHIGDGTASLGTAPDLLLVDGGMGQVHAAQAALADAGLSIPVLGMVKDEYHKTRSLTNGEGELSIATDRLLYNFIYGIQEEAHRFAVRSVHQKKRKSLRRSSLQDIPGIGPRKAQILLSHYGAIARIKEADTEAIAALPGITEADAARIRAYFNEPEDTES